MLGCLEEWNISFAGCGFRSIYYVGALSCILEKVPLLVYGASKICGASSGCLVAAALTVGIPIEQLCMDILTTAREARKHALGVFNPTFSLLATVRDSLLKKLPKDAHLRASGKLCVSLTRISDGGNVLVSDFASREELIEVLLCSCFFPVYSGFIPPSYRGVHYMDGALSNNVPLFEQRNTIIMAPFSGESDICPREGTYNFLEVHYGNVSIQVNTGNVHRICTSFLPPRIETLAEICHNGYKDALYFLKERDLLQPEKISGTVKRKADGVKHCCELVKEASRTEKKKTMQMVKDSAHRNHRWLDPTVIQSLPEEIQRVLCEACRNSSHDAATWWSPLMYLLTIFTLPIQLFVSLVKRLMTSADFYRQTWRTRRCAPFSEQLCSNVSSDLSEQTGDRNIHTLIATIKRNFDKDACEKRKRNVDLRPSNGADVPASVKETAKKKQKHCQTQATKGKDS